MKSLITRTILVAILTLSGTAIAQDHDADAGDHEAAAHEEAGVDGAHADSEHSADEHEEGHEEGHEEEHHGHHKNTFAGFLGFTAENRRDRGLTVGLEYTRWITPSWAIGVGAERAFGDLNFAVVTVPVTFRYKHWKIYAGPGWEKPDEDNPLPTMPPGNPGARSGGSPADNSTHPLVRIGVEYEIDKGSYELGPKVMVDIIDGDVVFIAGVAVAFGF